MKTFDEFCKYIKDNIQSELQGIDVQEIKLQEVIKNNDTKMVGIIIHEENTTITPNIYLEGFYEDYQKGENLEHVLESVAQCYMANRAPDISKDVVELISDYETAKSKLFACIVNTEANKEMLETMPHKEIMDLSIIYKICATTQSGKDMGTIKVTNDLMGKWGVTAQQLYEDAMSNTNKLFPAKVQTLGEILKGMMEHNPMPVEIENPMYVITNTQGMHAAIQMLNTEVLNDLAEKIGGDVIILPSSIHEVIVVPATTGDLFELAQMVKEINATVVSEEERLSDTVYYYDAEDKQVMTADEYQQRQEEDLSRSR